VSRSTRGIVSIRHHARTIEVQVQHVRRHLQFFVFLAALGGPATTPKIVWEHIQEQIEQTTWNTLKQVVMVYHRGRWRQSSNDSTFVGMMSAILFLAENNLHLHNVVSARFGRGTQETSAIHGFERCMIFLWRSDQNHPYFAEIEATPDGRTPSLQVSAYRLDWQQVRCLQLSIAPAPPKTWQKHAPCLQGDNQSPGALGPCHLSQRMS
jgi:hypothetical protein